ncbi:MAG: DUF3006 domain-containing protein [Clostridiaceae bacterium]|nr:DUF3006 domain-containing protein [Clostridiaceae bacterium]
MKELFIVDRIEDEYVVLETYEGEMIDERKERIKGNVKDGDCLIRKGNYFIIDEKATDERKKEIEERIKGMWR